MANLAATIKITADDQASKVLRNVGDAAQDTGNKAKNFLTDNFKAAGVASGVLLAGLTALTKGAVENAASFEQNRVAFESMLGSASKAQELLKQVSDFAQRTPFELPQVVEGSKRLLAYNIAAKDIIPTFKMLGDIASGVGTDKLNPLITAFGQVQAKGKLAGQELLQFTEAGVGLGQALQKQLGLTRDQLEKMISAGQISAEEVTKALQTMTSEGGLFFQGMERQSKTFNGVMSNVSDSFGKFVREVVGISDTGDIREGSLFAVLKVAAENLLVIMEKLRPVVTEFVTKLVANKEALIAIAGAFTALAIAAAIAAAIAWGPIILAVIAIAAVGAILAVVIYRIINAFEGWANAIGNFVGNTITAWNQFVATIQEGITAIGNFFGSIPGIIMGAFNSVMTTVGNFLTAVGNALIAAPGLWLASQIKFWTVDLPYAIGFLIGWASTAIPAFVEAVVAFFNALPGRVQALWDQMVFFIIASIVLLIAQSLSLIDSLINSVNQFFSRLPGIASAWFDAMKTAIITRVTQTGQATSTEVNTWPGKIQAAIASIPGIVEAIFNDMKNRVGQIMMDTWSTVTYWWNKISEIFQNIINKANDALNAAKNAFSAGFSAGAGRATGGIVPGPVGSPQMVLAHGGEEIRPFRQESAMGSPINLTVQVGMFAGTEIEIRNIAEKLYQALVTIASTQNKSVAEMFGT